MDTRTEEKRGKLLKALEQGMTQIHLDARRPGVLVPKRFQADHHLVLNLSYRFDPPDLTVNDWGVRETLSFGGERFTVGVPWTALYAIASHVSHDFFMFPDDMPEELLQGAAAKQQDAASAIAPEGRSEAAVVLAQVAAGLAQDETKVQGGLREVVGEAAGEEPPKAPTPPKRGHLRLVK